MKRWDQDIARVPVPAGWEIQEWVRGTVGYGQARCVRDSDGTRAYVTTLRTREQDIRRELDAALASPGK